MTLRGFILCLASVVLLGAQPGGQAPPPPPPIAWWDNPVANGLELTDAQKDQVNVIRKQHNDRLLQRREAVDRAERELDAVFNSATADRERARVAIDQLASARGELTREVSWMMLRMRGVLTFDQWKMLEARRQNPPDRGKGRGRGYRGPGSGPGFNDAK